MFPVNLQETMEAMLDQRRQLVGKLTPAEQSRLLHEGLGNLLEQSLYAQGFEDGDLGPQHETLRQLAGCVLYLLHPEDEASVEGTWDTVEELEGLIRGLVPNAAFHVVAGLGPDGQPAGLPRPLPAGARVRILDLDEVWVSDGKGGWVKQSSYEDNVPAGYVVVGGDDITGPVVYRTGDGTYRRKPRPDRV